MRYRNNLFMGRGTLDRGVMRSSNATDASSSDYKGFRPNKEVEEQCNWLAPRPGGVTYPAHERRNWRASATLADFRKATGREQHGVELAYDIFERMAPSDPATPSTMLMS